MRMKLSIVMIILFIIVMILNVGSITKENLHIAMITTTMTIVSYYYFKKIK